MATDGPAEVSEEQLRRIELGVEQPPKPDFLSEQEWQDILASRDPSTIRTAGTLQVDMYRQGVEGADTAQGGPVLVITTTGRRSGRQISTCLNYMEHGDDLLVVGSFAALAPTPSWVLNLEADPHCRVELGDRSWSTVARPITGDERAEFWPQMTDYFPLWGHFQRYCRREFPVYALPREPRS